MRTKKAYPSTNTSAHNLLTIADKIIANNNTENLKMVFDITEKNVSKIWAIHNMLKGTKRANINPRKSMVFSINGGIMLKSISALQTLNTTHNTNRKGVLTIFTHNGASPLSTNW